MATENTRQRKRELGWLPIEPFLAAFFVFGAHRGAVCHYRHHPEERSKGGGATAAVARRRRHADTTKQNGRFGILRRGLFNLRAAAL